MWVMTRWIVGGGFLGWLAMMPVLIAFNHYAGVPAEWRPVVAMACGGIGANVGIVLGFLAEMRWGREWARRGKGRR